MGKGGKDGILDYLEAGLSFSGFLAADTIWGVDI